MSSIAIATEDELSEQVAIRLVTDAGLEISLKLRRNGNGYLRGNIQKFAHMSRTQPLLLITDLDRVATPEKLRFQWLGDAAMPDAFLFHVSVREVEAWLLADHPGMQELLGKRIGKLPLDPESLADPKAHLLKLAAKAIRDVRFDLVAERNSMAAQGVGYNSRLCSFVREMWSPDSAAELSPSLVSIRKSLSAFRKKVEN